MIIGTGVDIIEISRIENMKYKEAFLKKMFTSHEMKYLETKKTESIAGYFCAKEAIVKAMGTGFSGFNFTDVEILKKNSAPYVVLHGNAIKIAKDKGILEIHVSISHSKAYANAVAVAEGSGKKMGYAAIGEIENSNSIKELNISSSVGEETIVEKDQREYPWGILKTRKKDSHKGNYGRNFIIGGSYTMSGAVILAAKAAFRSGAGLVTCVLPRSILDRVGGQVLEATYMLSEGSDSHIDLSHGQMEEIISRADVIAFGIGMGTNIKSEQNIKYLLENYTKGLVIDADGINLLHNVKHLLKTTRAKVVLTPHTGELARLTDLNIEFINSNRQEVAKSFAKEYNCIVLLKGANTIVTDGERVYVNQTGNPGMASGGSGDTLTGIITALIGQGYNIFDGAALGACLHGAAGDSAFSQYGYGLIASDLIDCLGNYLKG